MMDLFEKNEKPKELSARKMEEIGMRMIRSKDNFEGALGAAILYGNFNQKRKIFSTFERIVERFNPRKITER